MSWVSEVLLLVSRRVTTPLVMPLVGSWKAQVSPEPVAVMSTTDGLWAPVALALLALLALSSSPPQAARASGTTSKAPTHVNSFIWFGLLFHPPMSGWWFG